MTSQEEAMLNDLISRVEQTQLPDKDPEAEQLLNQTLARNPNALYILAQTVLVQKYALDQATAQISQLRQSQQPAHTTSFLGSLLGHRDPAPQPPPPPPVPPPGYGAAPYAQPWSQVPPGYTSGPASGGGGFLRSAATTAAGVAAGALAFEGVESLLHGFGHSSGFGGSGYFGGGMPEERITNNYYEGGERSGAEHRSSDSNSDATNLQQASDDLRNDSSTQAASLDDAAYDDASSFGDITDDFSQTDDSSTDDTFNGNDFA